MLFAWLFVAAVETRTDRTGARNEKGPGSDELSDPGPEGAGDFHGGRKALPRVEQTTLDCSDRRVERFGHFCERLAVDVKRLERLAIQILELVETGADLLVRLRRHDVVQWRNVIAALNVQDVVVGRGDGAAPGDSVDTQPARDSPQPSAKGGRIPHRADLPHGLKEHILAQFLGLSVVIRTPPAKREQLPLEPLVKFTERVAVAHLSGGDQSRDVDNRAGQCG